MAELDMSNVKKILTEGIPKIAAQLQRDYAEIEFIFGELLKHGEVSYRRLGSPELSHDKMSVEMVSDNQVVRTYPLYVFRSIVLGLSNYADEPIGMVFPFEDQTILRIPTPNGFFLTYDLRVWDLRSETLMQIKAT